ncbi:Dockerin type I repeat protein [Rubripirellula tenax]|uniref:Dockerin type I repeat protein n=1 Tax=Rubripirellula tenax TaxID=2528015 RepID=A0A5C6FBG2_9BACT|nr:Dockerin type I repeat protein [Rubripirellula tenax]
MIVDFLRKVERRFGVLDTSTLSRPTAETDMNPRIIATLFAKPKSSLRQRRGLAIERLQSRELMAVDFEFNYGGEIGSGIGFEDAVQGQYRRDLLQSAANQLGQWFDHTATIQLNVLSEEDQASDTIASAQSEFSDSSTPGFGQTEVVRRKVIDGVDLNGATSDGSVTVNWAVTWYTGVDPAGAMANEEDFFGTLFHEILHTFGFASDVTLAGEDGYGNAAGSPGVWSQFDRYLSDALSSPVIDSSSFVLDAALWDRVKLGGASPDRGLFFNGPNAMAVNGGKPVGLFSPKKFVEGSSWSHLDDENPVYDNALMRSAGSPDVVAPRSLSAVEVGIFRDLGFRMTEPTRLVVNVADNSIYESQRTTMTVDRGQANLASEVTVALTLNTTVRASVPVSVTIAAGQSSVGFALQATENLIIDNDSTVTITASADGFTADAATVVIRDNPFPFQNPNDIYDVNDDGAVTAADALLVINQISRATLPAVPPTRNVGRYFDVTGEGEVSALDALRVINRLARQPTTSLNIEGEAVGSSRRNAQAPRSATAVDICFAQWPILSPAMNTITPAQTNANPMNWDVLMGSPKIIAPTIH